MSLLSDRREAREARDALHAFRLPLPERFSPELVAQLPEPAQRYFLHALQPGARLAGIAELAMEGELSLGTRDDPKVQPMRARQVLAAPEGLLWEVQAGRAWMRIAGSDGMVGERSWTRLRLFGILPVVRAGGTADHLRSAFGRACAEAAIWAPASLLPQAGVRWLDAGPDTARALVTHRGMEQQVDIRVDARGQPLWVCMPRWSNANPQGVFRLQPFGGELGDFRTVEGCTVPFRVDGGNFFGTPDYFPFYRARVTGLRFP
ncbi:hypothetical protein H8N03_20075 [Ramlibacter sp. USB13]|uniref:Uncharacterized protein n=1 Tax=Ramlibacter cellulosilyticus TaxID=2764187 RepID=A0A923MTT0_9BURK|nr:DUF6544 family protein [Ramlibacter cellulosilyticus]MBC5785255.1 hypothetical protein [Ramlibacter cellulosilyticus]